MSPIPDMGAMSALRGLRDRVPGASFEVMMIMVSAVLGGRIIIEIHVNSIPMPDLPKSWTRVFAHMFRHLISRAGFTSRLEQVFTQKFMKIAGPAPRGPQREPQ